MVMGTFWARQDDSGAVGDAAPAPADISQAPADGGDQGGIAVAIDTSQDQISTPIGIMAPLAVSFQQAATGHFSAPAIGVFQQDTSGNWIPVSGPVVVNTPLLIRITGYEIGAKISLTIIDPMSVRTTQDVDYSVFSGTNPVNFTPGTAGIYQLSATGNTSLLGAVIFFLPNNVTVTASFTVVGAGAGVAYPVGPVTPQGPAKKPGFLDFLNPDKIGDTVKTGGFIALSLVGLLIVYNLTKGRG